MSRSYAQLISKHSICSLQDRGRTGFQHCGVPVSGPMDSRAWELANVLVDNNDNAAVLEIGMPALSLRFAAPAYLGVVAGNDEVTLNEQPMPFSQIRVSKGDVLELGHSRHLHFRYLAIRGGWLGTTVLNSRCTLPALGLPWLQHGAVLPFYTCEVTIEEGQREVLYSPMIPGIPVVPGPDFHYLDRERLQNLFKKMTLDQQLSRQAYGLKEKYPLSGYPKSFASVASFPGMIQLTPSGHFYVLMRDAQTTGGYLQVLYIPSHYLSAFSQALPGSPVSFKLHSDNSF
ncbi:MAG: biotin-dependent carboxyltransferase family protein [Saprospiraceae bacterium]|nr:biotin-dependent carboxyltransferase family protein [Saprospiraceae bacterium]